MLPLSYASNISKGLYDWHCYLMAATVVDLYAFTCRIIAVFQRLAAGNAPISGRQQDSASLTQNSTNVRRSEPSWTRFLLSLLATLTGFSGVTRPWSATSGCQSISLEGMCILRAEGTHTVCFGSGRWAGWSSLGRLVIVKAICYPIVAFTSKPIKQGVCLPSDIQFFYIRTYISWTHLYYRKPPSHFFLLFLLLFCIHAGLLNIWFMRSF